MKKSLLNPVFYERTKDGEVFYDISSRLIKDRVIFVSEPITSDLAATVSSLLFMMNNNDDKASIQLWLNTPGGDISSLFAIYDMMQLIKAPVETYCIGEAASAGAVLLSAGSKGTRTATPNANIMIHQVQLSGVFKGDGTSFSIQAAQISKAKNKIAEILARHTGQPIDKVIADTDRDLYLTAEEALEYGIIDRIFPVNKEIPSLSNRKSKKKTKKAATKKASRSISKKRG